MRTLQSLFFALAITALLVAVPRAYAQEAAAISLEEFIAAIDAVCPCDSEEELAPTADDDDDSTPHAPLGRCISRLSKLRQAVRTLDFFGLIDGDADAFTEAARSAKRECQAEQNGNGKKKGKGKKKGQS